MTSPSRILIVEGMKFSLDILEDLSDVLPAPIPTLISLTKHIIGMTEAMRTNREECGLLRDQTIQLLVVVMATTKKRSISSTLPEDLMRNLERLECDLKTVVETLNVVGKVANSTGLFGKLKAILLAQANAGTIMGAKNSLSWAITAFQVETQIVDSIRLCEVSGKVDAVLAKTTNALLESLPRAKYASYNCERPDKPSNCLQGTRIKVLQAISHWSHDSGLDSPNIYFFNGIAGVGKTTVARTVAAKAESEGILGADCFFSRQEPELRDATKVIPTIAYRLAQFGPDFGVSITAAVEKYPQSPYGSFSQQLDHLILEPLSALGRDRSRTVVLVLDAVDECEPKGAAEILRLLVAATARLPFFLKIFITGRPEAHILSALGSAPSPNSMHTYLFHSEEPSVIRNDIRLYLRAALAALPRQLGVDLPLDWVSDHELALLVEKSDNLFIYAVTAVRFLSDEGVSDPRFQLDTLLGILRSKKAALEGTHPFRELDALYMLLLGNTLSSTNNPAHVLQLLQVVLGTAVLVRDSLSQAALEKLAGLHSGQAKIPLRQLQSVILAPTPPDDRPRIYHPSFPDFIQDPARCTDPRFYINTSVHEARITIGCLDLLATHLQNGILADLGTTFHNRDVPDLEGKIGVVYPPEIWYSCRFWMSHLMSTSPGDCDIGVLRKALDRFASTALLPWLEAMSWRGEALLALKCLEETEDWAIRSLCSSKTISLLNATFRFLLSNFAIISDSTIQISRSVPSFGHGPAQLTYQDLPGSESTAAFLSPISSGRTSTSGSGGREPPGGGFGPQIPLDSSVEFQLFPLIEDHEIALDSYGPLEISTASTDIFLGHHQTFGNVTIKQRRLGLVEFNRDGPEIRRLERDARVWFNLKHRFVLPFLGIYRSARLGLCLVSPYAEDGTLVSYLEHHSSEADRRELLSQAAEAIAYIHGRQIIHADIRGTNFFISSSHDVLLSGFDIARSTDAADVELQSGPLSWQSPELMFNGTYSLASDVYAYGMTIYEVLSGRCPFDHLGCSGQLARALYAGERPRQEPAFSPRGISYAGLWAVAVECWRTNPGGRPSMQEICNSFKMDDHQVVDVEG